jgi:hypothetical protein
MDGRIGDYQRPAGRFELREMIAQAGKKVPADQDIVTPVGQINSQFLH